MHGGQVRASALADLTKTGPDDDRAVLEAAVEQVPQHGTLGDAGLSGREPLALLQSRPHSSEFVAVLQWVVSGVLRDPPPRLTPLPMEPSARSAGVMGVHALQEPTADVRGVGQQGVAVLLAQLAVDHAGQDAERHPLRRQPAASAAVPAAAGRSVTAVPVARAAGAWTRP